MSEQKELRVRYTGDAGQLVSEINRAEGAHGRLESRLQAAGSKFKNIGSQLSSVGRSMTLGLTVPIVGLGVAAVKAAVDFESAFTGVRKTVDATEAEFKALETGIRNMAKEIPATTTELSAIAETAGALGIAKKDILAFTRTVADMGETTDLTADAAATAFGKLGNVLGLTGDDFSRLGSTIVDLGNKGASTESEIVELTLRLAGSAKVAGFAADEIVGLAAAIADAGIQAEAGGTAMSQVIQKIGVAVAEGGSKLTNFAKVAGASASDFSAAWEADPALALSDFLNGLKKTSEGGKNLDLVLKDLGITGARQVDTLKRLALAQNDLGRSLAIADNAWRENTALAAEAEKRYATVSSQWQIFKNTVQDALITLGAALLPVLQELISAAKPVIDGIGRMFEAFAKLPTGVKVGILAFAGFLAAIGPILVAVGAIVSAIGAIATVAGPLAIVVGIMAALAGIGVLIYQNWSTLQPIFAQVWAILQSVGAWIASVFSPLIATISAEFTGVVDAVRASWPQIQVIIAGVLAAIGAAWNTWGVTVLNNVKTVFGLIVTSIGTAIKVVANVIKLVLAVIRGDWGAAWNAIKAIASAVWNQIRAVISAAVNVIRNVITTALNVIRAVVSAHFAVVRALASAAWNGIKTIVSAAVNAIKSVVTSGFNAIKSVVLGVWNAIVSAARSAWNTVIGIVEGAVSKIKSAVDAIKGALDFILPGSPVPLVVGAEGSAQAIKHLTSSMRALNAETARSLIGLPGVGTLAFDRGRHAAVSSSPRRDTAPTPAAAAASRSDGSRTITFEDGAIRVETKADAREIGEEMIWALKVTGAI